LDTQNQVDLPIFRDARGLEFFHYDETETRFVYKEIFQDQVYFRHGITLSKGDCVWDIGANIGLFTVFVQENFEEVQVHAFEPSPKIHQILAANCERYGRRVITHCSGVAGQEREAMFTFYPHYSILSGFQARTEQDDLALRAGIRAQWRRRYPNRPYPEDRLLDDMVLSALSQKQEYVCSLQTISQLIQKTGTEEIHLLKIDAEGSELDILCGIRDEHWPVIRQIVMEIHDGEAAAAIIRILEARGFQTILEQEAGLHNSGIVNCYATRRSADSR
jgi:FkbM family methyltransferase